MAPSNSKKKNSRVRTLRDLNAGIDDDGYKKNAGTTPEMKIAHIPDLPQSDIALALLKRIHKEFYPIAQKRGYKILTLSEMCCCGDGLDHGVLAMPTEMNARKRRKRRKKKIMPSNVLGYNQSRGNIHTIHLRLRQARAPGHGKIMSYDDVAGTMSHELAHCVVGPHNAKFYKLMDAIQEQHAVYMARGIVVDTSGFPVGSQEAYVLGRGGGGGNTSTVATAAEARRHKTPPWMPGGPQVLGGDKSFRQWLTPGEAAAGAAEARRLQDEQWCLPCNNDNDPIELLESSSDEEDGARIPAKMMGLPVIHGEEDAKLPATTTAGAEKESPPHHVVRRITPINITTATKEHSVFAATSDAAIDLTGDGDEAAVVALQLASGWTCSQCTYRNHGNNPLLLACSMCGSEKSSAASQSLISKLLQKEEQQRIVASEQLLSKLVRDEAVAQIKSTEVERSNNDFGFNIYGNDR